MEGAPIMSVVCYCDDCQSGARQIEALPNAGAVVDIDGGTAYVLYRKDRFKCTKGAHLLKGYKLKQTSTTNRMVATCCNSAMFLAFDGAPHWVSVYRARIQGGTPPLQMRINTKFKRANSDIPKDVPGYATVPVKFVGNLMAAKLRMLLHR